MTIMMATQLTSESNHFNWSSSRSVSCLSFGYSAQCPSISLTASIRWSLHVLITKTASKSHGQIKIVFRWNYSIYYFVLDMIAWIAWYNYIMIRPWQNLLFFLAYFAFLLCSINLPILLFPFTHFALSFTHFAFLFFHSIIKVRHKLENLMN